MPFPKSWSFFARSRLLRSRQLSSPPRICPRCLFCPVILPVMFTPALTWVAPSSRSHLSTTWSVGAITSMRVIREPARSSPMWRAVLSGMATKPSCVRAMRRPGLPRSPTPTRSTSSIFMPPWWDMFWPVAATSREPMARNTPTSDLVWLRKRPWSAQPWPRISPRRASAASAPATIRSSLPTRHSSPARAPPARMSSTAVGEAAIPRPLRTRPSRSTVLPR